MNPSSSSSSSLTSSSVAPQLNQPYSIHIGESLTLDNNNNNSHKNNNNDSHHPIDTFHVFRYDFKPGSLHKQQDGTLYHNNDSRVDIDFSATNTTTSNNNTPTVSSFTGKYESQLQQSQHHGRTDCVLIFDPINQTFTLERVFATISNLKKMSDGEVKKRKISATTTAASNASSTTTFAYPVSSGNNNSNNNGNKHRNQQQQVCP